MSEDERSPVVKALTGKPVFWAAMMITLVADLGSKAWASAVVQPSRKNIEVIPGLLDLKWAENTGAAFSMLSGQPVVLSLLALVMLSAMGWVMYNSSSDRRVLHAGLGLVCAGAIGNLADRLTLGFVRDFLFFPFELPMWESVSVIPKYWPVFNVADMCIIAGAILLAIGPEEKAEPARTEAPSDEAEAAS